MGLGWTLLFSLSQKLLDRLVNTLFVLNLRKDERFVLGAEGFFEDAIKLAAAVGAFDLAVTEQVALGQERFFQHAEGGAVVFAPVVAIGELEAVDVPFARIEVGLHHVLADFVGR